MDPGSLQRVRTEARERAEKIVQGIRVDAFNEAPYETLNAIRDAVIEAIEKVGDNVDFWYQSQCRNAEIDRYRRWAFCFIGEVLHEAGIKEAGWAPGSLPTHTLRPPSGCHEGSGFIVSPMTPEELQDAQRENEGFCQILYPRWPESGPPNETLYRLTVDEAEHVGGWISIWADGSGLGQAVKYRNAIRLCSPDPPCPQRVTLDYERFELEFSDNATTLYITAPIADHRTIHSALISGPLTHMNTNASMLHAYFHVESVVLFEEKAEEFPL